MRDVIPLPEPLWVTVDPDFAPQALPKTERVPISLRVPTTIQATGAVVPPPLEELLFELDRNLLIDGRALPKCGGPSLSVQLSLAEIERMCDGAIVGGGSGEVALTFPGQPPTPAALDLAVFNGRTDKRGTVLFAVAEMTDPLSLLIPMPIEIRRRPKGRIGSEVVVTVPKIAGGVGSLIDLELTVRRRLGGPGARDGVASLRCPDGTFILKMRARFAGGPQVRGEFPRKCRSEA